MNYCISFSNCRNKVQSLMIPLNGHTFDTLFWNSKMRRKFTLDLSSRFSRGRDILCWHWDFGRMRIHLFEAISWMFLLDWSCFALSTEIIFLWEKKFGFLTGRGVSCWTFLMPWQKKQVITSDLFPTFRGDGAALFRPHRIMSSSRSNPLFLISFPAFSGRGAAWRLFIWSCFQVKSKMCSLFPPHFQIGGMIVLLPVFSYFVWMKCTTFNSFFAYFSRSGFFNLG